MDTFDYLSNYILEKSQALPVGTIKQWKGKTYRKTAPDQWVQVRVKRSDAKGSYSVTKYRKKNGKNNGKKKNGKKNGKTEEMLARQRKLVASTKGMLAPSYRAHIGKAYSKSGLFRAIEKYAMEYVFEKARMG